ncbi:MAG: transcriptional regulator [Thermodesulfovibrionales bacterium]
MKKKPLEPREPEARHETIRKRIASLLEGRTLSARDLSAEVGVSEKEVYGHLAHIERSVEGAKGKGAFQVTPAQCRKCGYVFRKRERLQRPGRCPLCRGEQIEDPLFAIRPRSS